MIVLVLVALFVLGGVMTLASPDEAVLVADSGPEVRFRPAPGDYRPPPCA